MKRFTEDFYTPETSMEEYAMIIGRIDALMSFIKDKYEVKASDVMAILGYSEEE